MATINYAWKCAEICKRCWNQKKIYCFVFPMDEKRLRELDGDGKTITKKGNSKKASNSNIVPNIYNWMWTHTLFKTVFLHQWGHQNYRSNNTKSPLCLNCKNSTSILEDDGNPDFKTQTESADEFLEIWRKGQSYLNELRLTQMVEKIAHIKENAPRTKWRMGKIVELIENRGDKIRAASVLLSNENTIKRPSIYYSH